MSEYKIVPMQRAMVLYGVEHIRAVIVHETEGDLSAYVAHGVDRDVSAQGKTPEQALARLRETAKFDAEGDNQRGDPLGPAPQYVEDWWQQAPKEAQP